MGKKYKTLIIGIFAVIMLAGLVSADWFNWDEIKGDLKSTVKSTESTDRNTGIEFYDKHYQIIDFLVMFVLFTAISFVGLQGFMKEGGKSNAVKGIAVAVGAALSLAGLKAGISPSFFIPFVKNALFFIIMFVIFVLLIQIEGLKDRKLVAFILALIITMVAFNVTNIVLHKDDKWDFTKLWSAPTATEIDNLNSNMAKIESKSRVICNEYGVSQGRDTHEVFVDKCVKAIEAKIAALSPKVKDYDEKVEEMEDDIEQLYDYQIDFNEYRNDKFSKAAEMSRENVDSAAPVRPESVESSDELEINVYGDTQILAGESATLNIKVPNAGQPKYRWYIGNEVKCQIDSCTIKFDKPGSHPVKIIVEDGGVTKTKTVYVSVSKTADMIREDEIDSELGEIKELLKELK